MKRNSVSVTIWFVFGVAGVRMRAERLREARLKNHLTQEELAEKLNIDKMQISRWERGHKVPRGETLAELASSLNVSVDYLLGVSDEPTIRVRIDNLTIEEIAIITALRKGDDKEAIKIIASR